MYRCVSVLLMSCGDHTTIRRKRIAQISCAHIMNSHFSFIWICTLYIAFSVCFLILLLPQHHHLLLYGQTQMFHFTIERNAIQLYVPQIIPSFILENLNEWKLCLTRIVAATYSLFLQIVSLFLVSNWNIAKESLLILSQGFTSF